MKFIELTEHDLERYERLVKPHLLKEDFITPAEYREYLGSLTLFRSWFLVDERDDRCVGWCAAGEPSDTVPGAVHFYGGVILPPFRGRGFSHLLYTHRFAAFPGRDFTASVQPHSIIALNSALAYGFKPFRYQEPWIELVRRHQVTDEDARDAGRSARAPALR